VRKWISENLTKRIFRRRITQEWKRVGCRFILLVQQGQQIKGAGENSQHGNDTFQVYLGGLYGSPRESGHVGWSRSAGPGRRLEEAAMAARFGDAGPSTQPRATLVRMAQKDMNGHESSVSRSTEAPLNLTSRVNTGGPSESCSR
jgi:hypothetical protein